MTLTLAYPVSPQTVPAGGHFDSDWMIDSAGRKVKRANRHTGVDFGNVTGKAIKAIGDATVVYVGKSASWGYYVWLHHGKDSVTGKQVWSAYAHMKSAARVKVGQDIKRGTTLGYVGATGNVSGAHLHHVIALCATLQQAMSLARSVLTDPIKFIAARLSKPAPKPAANQRQVKPATTVRRRKAPTTKATYNPLSNLTAGKIVTPSGYIRSTEPGGTVDGSNAWLVIGGLYSHVSGFTSASVANLVDLTPPPVIIEPNPPAPTEPDPLPEEPDPAPEPEPEPEPTPDPEPNPNPDPEPTPPAQSSGLLGAIVTVGALILGALTVWLSQLGG